MTQLSTLQGVPSTDSKIDPEQFVNTKDNTSKNFAGMAVFQFYKTAEDKQLYKSSATLVIVKK